MKKQNAKEVKGIESTTVGNAIITLFEVIETGKYQVTMANKETDELRKCINVETYEEAVEDYQFMITAAKM